MNDTDEKGRNLIINKESLICGLYLGLIMVAMYLLAWLTDPVFTTNGFIDGSLMLIGIGLLCIFLLSVRSLAGSFWTYWQAFRSAIVISLMTLSLVFGWNYLLYHQIDPGLGFKIADINLPLIQREFLKAGLSQAKIDASKDAMRLYSNPGTPKVFMVSIAKGVTGAILISLILAVIVKKDKPVFTRN